MAHGRDTPAPRAARAEGQVAVYRKRDRRKQALVAVSEPRIRARTSRRTFASSKLKHIRSAPVIPRSQSTWMRATQNSGGKKASGSIELIADDVHAKLSDRLERANVMAEGSCKQYFETTLAAAMSYWQSLHERLLARHQEELDEIYVRFPVLQVWKEGLVSIPDAISSIAYVDNGTRFVRGAHLEAVVSRQHRMRSDEARDALQALNRRHKEESQDLARRKERVERALVQARAIEESRLRLQLNIAGDQLEHAAQLKVQCAQYDGRAKASAAGPLRESACAAAERAQTSLARLAAYTPNAELDHILYELLQTTEKSEPAVACSKRASAREPAVARIKLTRAVPVGGLGHAGWSLDGPQRKTLVAICLSDGAVEFAPQRVEAGTAPLVSVAFLPARIFHATASEWPNVVVSQAGLIPQPSRGSSNISGATLPQRATRPVTAPAATDHTGALGPDGSW